jgi:hypothetical protein
MGVFIELFGKSPMVAVLEAFAENPDEMLSVPEILTIADGAVSRMAAYYTINNLLKEGIITKVKKEKKCNYYKFNENDPRGKALIFLEKILAIGKIEQAIRKDIGLQPQEKLPDGLISQSERNYQHPVEEMHISAEEFFDRKSRVEDTTDISEPIFTSAATIPSITKNRIIACGE